MSRPRASLWDRLTNNVISKAGALILAALWLCSLGLAYLAGAARMFG